MQKNETRLLSLTVPVENGMEVPQKFKNITTIMQQSCHWVCIEKK
jgi:hypothetical protein